MGIPATVFLAHRLAIAREITRDLHEINRTVSHSLVSRLHQSSTLPKNKNELAYFCQRGFYACGGAAPCPTSQVIAHVLLSCRPTVEWVQDQPTALSSPLALASPTLQAPYRPALTSCTTSTSRP
jgi:hypothetical protein